MIKSIHLKNFQSHLNSFLEFSEGINVITGASNNGKTSILRSLLWIFFNRPQGLSFKSFFAGKKDSCKVILQTNNQEITREKNTSINQYQVGSSIFNTIGNDVPSEVFSVINMSEINIQSQFDKHFLLLDSAGEVGRTINKIVKLDNIDELISNLTSKINSISKEVEIKKKDLDKLYVDLERFKDFDKIEELVLKITKDSEKSENCTNIISSLKHIIFNISETDKIINNIENEYVGIEEKINNLEQSWIKYHTNIEVIKDLSKLIKSIRTEEEIIIKAENIIKDEEIIQLFEQNIIKYISLKDVHFRLNHIIEEWGAHTSSIKKIEKTIEKDEVEFEKILKDFGCPLCGKSL